MTPAEEIDRLRLVNSEMVEVLEFIAKDCANCLCDVCLRYRTRAEAAIQKARGGQ
jgi:hypothetical protein